MSHAERIRKIAWMIKPLFSVSAAALEEIADELETTTCRHDHYQQFGWRTND